MNRTAMPTARRIFRRLLSGTVAALMGLTTLLCAQPAGAAAGTTMSISLASSSVDVGASFDAQVIIQTSQETMAAQCGLSFNPAVLKCTGVAVGDYYDPDMVIPSPSQVIIDNTEGAVEFMSVTMLGSVSGKTGTFLVYHFKGKAAGTSYLNLTDAMILDDEGMEIAGAAVNNGTITVGTQAQPDVTVTALSPAWAVAGSTYTVSYTLANQGTAAAGAFKAGLYVDGAAQPVVTEDIASLAAGSSYSGTFSSHPVQLSGATDAVRVCADSGKVLAESNENNNCREASFGQGSPPDQPANASPADAASGISLTPTLQSAAFSDPDAGDTHAASQWQITTVSGDYSSPAFDSGADGVNLITVVMPADRLAYSTTCYWRVRHQDNVGNWSEWSVESSFTTAAVPNQPPDRPSSVSPENAATGLGLMPTLAASSFSDADAGNTHAASQWQVRADSGSYSAPAFDSGMDGTNLTGRAVASGALQPSATYYWHVRYQDSAGDWSEWSAETSFTTAAAAGSQPSQPIGTSPEGGAVNVGLTPALQSALFSDPDAGDTHAASHWQITAAAGDYSSPVFDSGADAAHLASIEIPSGLLGHATNYYWRVRHQDSTGTWSEWSPETSFTTMPTGTPSVATTDAASVTADSARLGGDLVSLGTAGSVTVSFVWGTTAGGPYSNETPGAVQTASGAFYFDLSGLTSGWTYHYRARAAGDETSLGEEKSFTTGLIPQVDGVEPASGKRNEQLTVTILGTSLEGTTEISFGPGITVDEWNAGSGTEITARISVDDDAELGMRDVLVTNGFGTGTLTEGFDVVGGKGGICSIGAPWGPEQGSELTTVMLALAVFFGGLYWTVRKACRSSDDPAWRVDTRQANALERR